MSSFLDEVTTELTTDTAQDVSVDTNKPEETVAETKIEPSEPVSEPEKDKEWSKEAPAEWSKPDDPKPEHEPAKAPDTETTPKPKKDLSGLTKEEKAAFSFKRQLEKQRHKYESEISKMTDKFSEIQKDIESLKSAQPKEQPKTRTDFDSDDDYIRYLSKQSVDDVLAEQKKQAADEEARKALEAEEEKRQKEDTDRFTANCAKVFTDEEQYAEFAKKVNKGLSNGLGELLDQVPTVRDYLFQNPNGPRVLNAMLSDREAFVRVMSRAQNPIEATIEMHEMAKELMTAPASAPAAPTPVPTPQQHLMPSIGKPGKGSAGTAPDVFSSDESILKFIRGR